MLTAIEDTVTDMDEKHEYILYAGIMFWLQRMGFKPGDPRIATAVINDTAREWKGAIGDYIADKVNDDQATGGLDIIALGDVS